MPLAPEPFIRLPTVALLAASALGSGAVVAVVWAIGLGVGRPDFGPAGLVAGLVVIGAAWVSILITVPWMPKPASTAGLAWMAGSMLRMLGAAGIGFLLYSAPSFGGTSGPAVASSAFLLTLAAAFFAGVLCEVAVIARHVLPPSQA